MKKVISLLMVVLLIASIGAMVATGLSANGFVYTVENDEATITDFVNSTAAITIPDSIGGYPVTKIGDYAFANRLERKSADISSLTLPSTLKVIGDGAFTVNSSMSSIVIPASVESIGARAFHCWINLSTVSFRGNNLISIGKWAFRNCHSLRSISFPVSLEVIEAGAFSYCPALSSITLPESVEEVGEDAFLGCTSLSNVTMLNKNLAIGDNAFDLTAASGANRTLRVSGYADSSAQRFANAEQFNFNVLEEPVTPPDEPTPDDPPVPSSGDYYVRVTYTITGTNPIKAKYGGFNKEVNDSAGISLLYKDINGTAAAYKEISWDLGGTMTAGTTGTFTADCSVSGFPYMLYGYLDDNRAGGSAAYNINKLEVGSSAQNMITVWTGEISLASQFHAFGVSLDWENNSKNTYFYTPDGNNKVKSSSGAWEKPYAKTIGAAFESDRLALSADSESVNNAFTYAAQDQYGVAMDYSLCKLAQVTTPAHDTLVTFSNGRGNVECSKQLHLEQAGVNEQPVQLQFSWNGKDRTTTGESSFTLIDEQYTIRWLNDAGELLYTTDVFYGDTQSFDLPAKEPDAQYHYSATAWSPAPTAVTGPEQYTAQYSAQEHHFERDERYDTVATCTAPGAEVYICSDCGYLKSEETPMLSHSFALGDEKAATCDQAGYREYSCSACEASYRETIAATGHDFSLEAITEQALRTAASKDTDATYYYSCAKCSKVNQIESAYFVHTTASVSGSVDMENQYKPITVSIMLGDEVVDSCEIAVGSEGSFSFFGLEPANYTLIFSGESTTMAEFETIDLSGGKKLDLSDNEDAEVSLINVTNGDVNRDGTVDFSDISMILANGIYGSANAAADVNNDGVVSVDDIAITLMAQNYGSVSKWLNV